MRLVALIAVLSVVSVAGAGEQVWFVATSGPAPVTQGAAGTTLVLPGPGVYDIQAWVGVTDPMFSIDVALKGPAGDSGAGLVVTTVPGASWGTDFATVGAGASLFHVGQSSITAPAWAGTTLFASFTLTAVAGDIIGGAADDGYGWGTDMGEAPAVQYGSYFAADGYPGSWADGPAIKVLPEPATLALLGFGLVGLLRRR